MWRRPGSTLSGQGAASTHFSFGKGQTLTTTTRTASTPEREPATRSYDHGKTRRLRSRCTLHKWRTVCQDKEKGVAPGVKFNALNVQRPHSRPDAPLAARAEKLRMQFGNGLNSITEVKRSTL